LGVKPVLNGDVIPQNGDEEVIKYKKLGSPSKLFLQISHLNNSLSQRMSQTTRLGAVQAEPVWLGLQGSIEKTIKIDHEVGEKGINVLGIPEVWFPGYSVVGFLSLSLSSPI
jgi:hypothetical protein